MRVPFPRVSPLLFACVAFAACGAEQGPADSGAAALARSDTADGGATLESEIELRLVDAFDGAPLAELVVELRGDGGERRRAQSDEAGVARAQAAWSADALTVAPVGADGRADDARAVTLEAARTGVPTTVELSVGPTLELDLALPAGCDPAFLRAWIEPEARPRPPSADQRLELHQGPRPWVRATLAELERWSDGGPSRLVLRSQDGLWQGWAPLPAGAGRVAEPVHVALEACGVLRVRALDAEDGTTLEAADLRLFDSLGRELRARARRGAEGVLVVEAVLPGDYGLVVREFDHLEARRDVHVAAGAMAEVEVRLAPRAGGGDVAGEVHSQSGRARVADLAYLIPRGAESASFRTAFIEWDEEEVPAVGRFRFRDVPAGLYALSAAATVSGFAWEAEELEVVPPAEGLVLRLLDDCETAVLEISAVGRDSNRAVPNLTLLVGSDLPDEAPRVEKGVGRVRLGPVRAEPGLRWRLLGRGYLPVQGSLADLRREGEFAGHPRLTTDVEMIRGWTVRVRVWQGLVERVPGARVSIDGVGVGRTSLDGELDLRRDAPPRILRVEAPGFRPEVIYGIDGLPGDASDWSAPPILDVRLQRP